MPLKSFGAVFIAVLVASALVVGAFMINRARPAVETAQPNVQLVLATGKCAECHRRETPAIVHEFEMSKHAAKGVNCLDCHQPAAGQEKMEHRGFTISKGLTSLNCQQCHRTEYEQFNRSRHAAPAWAAVTGPKDFSPEQIAQGEKYHPGWVKRSSNALVEIEGMAAVSAGCLSCHNVGKPNADGSIGTCTNCHARHAASAAMARMPSTCGQCHLGPDHSQIEIYTQSKHGVLFAAQRDKMNLNADSRSITTSDMPVPTCSTCHMGGLNGSGMTHDTTERLSYYLFAPVSEKRPAFQSGQDHMKQMCLNCHTKGKIDAFYKQAEDVVVSANGMVKESQDLMKALQDDGLVKKGGPFEDRLRYISFDLWHYYGRTAKHGAFMGGADFVQWHGFFEIKKHLNEMHEIANQLRKGATTQPMMAPPIGPVGLATPLVGSTIVK